MATAVLLSGGLDSAVLLVEEAARGEVQPIYVQRRAGVGGDGARGDCAVPRSGGVERPRAAARRADRRHDATSTRQSHWAIAGPAARLSHAGRRRVPARPQRRSCSGRRPSSARRRGIGRMVHRHARSQSVSRRDTGLPRGDGSRRSSLGLGTRADDRRAVRAHQQGERHPPRRRRSACRSTLTLSCMRPAPAGGNVATAACAANAASAIWRLSRRALRIRRPTQTGNS